MRMTTIALTATLLLATVVAVYEVSEDDGRGQFDSSDRMSDATRVEVVYHAFSTDPEIDEMYNEPTGYDPSGSATLETVCHGERFHLEHNPQIWDRGQTWFAPAEGNYVVHFTRVFDGWRILDPAGRLTDTAYEPGQAIELREDGWHADDVLVAEHGSPIQVYAAWAVVQQVTVNDGEISDRDILVIGDTEYDITGRTSVTVPNQKATKTVTISTDNLGRRFVTTVHEKIPVRTEGVEHYVDVYGKRYTIPEGAGTVYVDHYPCTILEDRDGSRYIECYFFLMDEESHTVSVRGMTYPYVLQNEPDGTTYAYLRIYGDSESLSKCPISYKKDENGQTRCFLGYSRYYAVSGSTHTNIRLIDGNLGGERISEDLLDNCTIRGIGTDSSIDIGDRILHVGSRGCIIDHVSFGGDGTILSDGNLLRLGPGITEGEYTFAMAEGGAFDPLVVSSVFRDLSWRISDLGGLPEDSIVVGPEGDVTAGTVTTGTASDSLYTVTMQSFDPDHPTSASTITVTVLVSHQLSFSNTPEDGGLDR